MDTMVHEKHALQVPRTYPRAVTIWLMTGILLVFFQVVIGGVTRLTGSGLSITKWEIITGTFPPMSTEAWQEAFDLYKATPQYQKINQGMTMGEFRFIYFWEYFHRLWARMMGMVFVIPFFIFWRKGWIDKMLMRRLLVVIALAALVASFGWIMVASGLTDRPWVNAYKLSIHLSLALILYSYLFWTMLKTYGFFPQVINNFALKRWGLAVGVLLAVQIVIGGVMSGMKAGIYYPTWPDYNGAYIPGVLMDPEAWDTGNLSGYDSSPFAPSLIHFLHRNIAYILIVIGLIFSVYVLRATSSPILRRGVWAMAGLFLVQIMLGIITVINSLGIIPVGWGVLHQAGAMLLLSAVLYVNFHLYIKSK
jgi:cytochrome c oxidase assembly protein subunit 15